MTGGPDLVESMIPSPSPRSPRSAKRRVAFVSLAGLMAVLGIAAAAYYFAMRPVTLKVAVGPANSDDLRVVQTLAQAFNNQRNSTIRLRPIPTDGAAASALALADGKADLAIIRGGKIHEEWNTWEILKSPDHGAGAGGAPAHGSLSTWG